MTDSSQPLSNLMVVSTSENKSKCPGEARLLLNSSRKSPERWSLAKHIFKASITTKGREFEIVRTYSLALTLPVTLLWKAPCTRADSLAMHWVAQVHPYRWKRISVPSADSDLQWQRLPNSGTSFEPGDILRLIIRNPVTDMGQHLHPCPLHALRRTSQTASISVA